jgi:nitrogen fixation/metabolism regulation signal transduction histidine kinase
MKSDRSTKSSSLDELLQIGLICSVAIPIIAFAVLGYLIVQMDRTTLVLVCILCAIVVLLSVLIINYVVQRRIKERIRELIDVGIEYTEGNRTVRAPVIGDDDLAILSMTINKIFEQHNNMAEKILPLDERHQVRVYRNATHIILQIQREVPSDDDPLSPSFKVAVALSPDEATALASELAKKCIFQE